VGICIYIHTYMHTYIHIYIYVSLSIYIHYICILYICIYRKLAVGNPEERIGVLNFVLANEADGVPVLPSALTEAFSRIKRKSKLDHYGVSVSSIVLLAQVRPDAVAIFLHAALGSTAIMSNTRVRGKVFGKESSVTLASGL